MQFTLTEDGTLNVAAENAAEVMDVFKHYRLDDDPAGIMALAEALKAGAYTHSEKSAKRPWFQVDVYLDERSLEPYRKLLERCTGYSGNIPDMPLSHPCRLCHTHITDFAEIEDGMYHARTFVQAQEWNGKPADVRAERGAEDYAQEDIGKRLFEREFILAGNGQYKHNPDYAKHHKAQPGTGAPWLWDAIFSWWRTNEASAAQRAILNGVDALRNGYKSTPDYAIRRGGGDEAHLVGFSLYSLDPSGTCDYDGKGKMARVYSWDEFRAHCGQKG